MSLHQGRRHSHSMAMGILNGWGLVATVAATLAILVLIVIATTSGVDGVRLIIRITARTSFVLFCLAFCASALFRLASSKPTAWLLANRRYLGLSFALSHAVHAAAIIVFSITDPVLFKTLSTPGMLVTGGIAYGFIAAMAATSFDRTRALIGRRAWIILHTIGGWYIWISFVVTFGKRALDSSFHQPFVAVLAIVLIVKLVGFRLRRADRRRDATANA